MSTFSEANKTRTVSRGSTGAEDELSGLDDTGKHSLEEYKSNIFSSINLLWCIFGQKKFILE